MSTNSVIYWKRLWWSTTSENLTNDELLSSLGKKEVIEGLRAGICSYKPLKTELYSNLQSKYPEQTKLLTVVQTLQKYIDVDCFQVWEILKNYLSDISYGTPESALKNVAFLDIRPIFLLPHAWSFYYNERLFLLKLLQFIIEFKDHQKYHVEFKKIINDIDYQELKTSLICQFEKIISTAPPPREIQIDFLNENIRQQWAESNLREQLSILQILLLIADDIAFSESELKTLLYLFRKHNFGKNQSYNDLVEERHRELCLSILYIEVCLFMVILDETKIKHLPLWIDNTKETIDAEFNRLQFCPEHSAMLLSWMVLTLQSPQHVKCFEKQYKHYGEKALRMRVFEFLKQMLNSPVLCDESFCSYIAHNCVFKLLNGLCNKFDGDATISQQPGLMVLCADLLKMPEIACQFWQLYKKKEDFGVVSVWNRALEFFPHNFSTLSILAAALAQAGKSSIKNLMTELEVLAVYTEIYNPNTVRVAGLQANDGIICYEYYPLGTTAYRIEAGSKATIIEQTQGMMIHFRTPYSYWTVFNNECEKVTDHKMPHQNITQSLDKVYEGTKILKNVLKALVEDKEIRQSLVVPSKRVFEVIVRFMSAKPPPLPLLVEGLGICTALIPVFPMEIYNRLINTGILPRLLNQNLTEVEYANGVSFMSADVGSYLISIEQPSGTYEFLLAYIDMLCAFHEVCGETDEECMIRDILVPGVVFVCREVLPHARYWRHRDLSGHRRLLQRCSIFLLLVLQRETPPQHTHLLLLKKTCLYSLLYTGNALELLNIVSLGNDNLEKIIHDETNWISGSGSQYISTIQRFIAVIMLALRQLDLVAKSNETTPLEHLIFVQSKQRDSLKVIPKLASYIRHAFNRSLPVLCCEILKEFAVNFQISLFASLNMTACQIRVMFLDRLRDEYETMDLKIAILEFVGSCICTQPELTEAFFMLNNEQLKDEEENNDNNNKDNFVGVHGYMADYLGIIKADSKLLHSPLLASIMTLFRALWQNNMQIIVKKLREAPKFWEHITSPLFSEIQPKLRVYGQIFNFLGIELFMSRDKLEPSLKVVLEQFFDTNKKYLDTWIDYIFSLKYRNDNDESVDKVPVWLSLLTSWKDFTTIFCKCLPFSLNIAHKTKMVAPCLTALLNELDDLEDGRLVVILAELYMIMLENWKDVCFDNRKASAKQIENLLSNTTIIFEFLHPRAIRAITFIGTVAISNLYDEIIANSAIAQSIILSVTNINLKLLDNIEDTKPKIKLNGPVVKEDIPPVVLSLAMYEKCLKLYDDPFSGLSQWLQSTNFINRLLYFLRTNLQSRLHYQTSLAALRCLTAYARGPLSKELLVSNVEQFLWMQLLPPKLDSNTNGATLTWKPQEWWRVYSISLDFISVMVMKHGPYFASEAITFIGVHLEYLIEAILLIRQDVSMDSLNLCASMLNLVVQLVKFEFRWRIKNIHSLFSVMRGISSCVCQCVTLLMCARRPEKTEDTPPHPPMLLQRTLKILHTATLCLLAFSPDLLSLLADPGLDLTRWQLLVALNFDALNITNEFYPQLTIGTLLSGICLLTGLLNHTYHTEAGSSAATPSVSHLSPAASELPLDHQLVANALQALATLLASQALLVVRDPKFPSRHKQMFRRELVSELTSFHDFVRKRILCNEHVRTYLYRNKLGAWPLAPDEEEVRRLDESRRKRDPFICDDERPPPSPPKSVSQDSHTPPKETFKPVAHSTPISDKKNEASRSSEQDSLAETTRDSGENLGTYLQAIEPVYSNLTKVQINNDKDYFHFMSIVFLYICQTEL